MKSAAPRGGPAAWIALNWFTRFATPCDCTAEQGVAMSSKNSRRTVILVAGALALLSAGAAAPAAGPPVVRLPLPDNNDFPISSAVMVKGGVDTYFLSGALAPVVNKDAPKGSVAAYGDTETQTVGALNSVSPKAATLPFGA